MKLEGTNDKSIDYLQCKFECNTACLHSRASSQREGKWAVCHGSLLLCENCIIPSKLAWLFSYSTVNDCGIWFTFIQKRAEIAPLAPEDI